MVKKYFRPFICAVCTALSVLLGVGNLPLCISAEDMAVGTESGTEGETEAADEAGDAAGEEGTETAATEAITEAPAEAATEAVTEPAAEMAAETMPVADTPAVSETTPQPETVDPASDDPSGTSAAETMDGTDAPEGQPDGTEQQNSGEDSTGTQSEKSDTGESGADDEQQETEGVVKVTLDKKEYSVGDEIELKLENYNNEQASGVSFSFDIPGAMEFSRIIDKPAFKDRDAKILYKNEKDEWVDYTDKIDPAAVKGIKVQVDEGAQSLIQEKKLVVGLIAVGAMDDDIKVSCSEMTGGKETKSEASVHAKVSGEAAAVTMTQDPEAPAKGTEVKQANSITYNLKTDTAITYTVDPGVDLLELDFDENCFLIGGNAVISSSTGDTQVAVTDKVDLRSFSGIKSVKFIPPVQSVKGQKNMFTAILSIREDMDTYTNAITIVAGTAEKQTIYEYKQTFGLAYSSVGKPVLTHDGKQVPFGKDCTITMGNMGVHSYKTVATLDYTVLTPEFATLRKIQLPEISGADTMQLYLRQGEEEKLFGEFKSGEAVEIEKDDISGFRINVAVAGNDLAVTSDGSFTVASLNKKNRMNYFAFRASQKAVTEDKDITTVSDITAVTFEIYKEDSGKEPPQTEPPQTEPPQTEPMPGVPSQPSQPQPVQPAPDDPEENNPLDDIREEEENKRQEIVDKTLENDKEAKERQKELLANRISSIRNSAILSAVAPDSAQADGQEAGTAAAEFEDWVVKPISESLVKNLVPSVIDPIDEGIIENLVPQEV